MTNNTINIEALAEEFKVECKVIKLGYEYPGYTGTEKYAIVTDLSYAQIMERYAPIAEHYCPFLLLSKAAGEVIADYKRNEDKFSKRMQKDDCYGFEDGMTERYNIECCVPQFCTSLVSGALSAAACGKSVCTAYSHPTKPCEPAHFRKKVFCQNCRFGG